MGVPNKCSPAHYRIKKRNRQAWLEKGQKKYAVYTLEKWATLANENRIYGTDKTHTQNLRLGLL